MPATKAPSYLTVTDTRNSFPGWSVSGQASDFTGVSVALPYAIPADDLGWTPDLPTPR
jgi:hypothetical protein